MKKYTKELATIVAAGFLAGTLTSTANADPTDKTATTDLRHAVKHVRKAGQLATEHGIGDMKAQVKQLGPKSLHRSFDGNVVTLSVKNPDDEAAEEGRPFPEVVWNGEERTLEFVEGTTPNVNTSDPANIVMTKFEFGEDYTAIDRTLDGNTPLNLNVVWRAIDEDGRLAEVDVRTDTMNNSHMFAILNGMNTVQSEGPTGAQTPIVPGTAEFLNQLAKRVRRVDDILPGYNGV